MCTWIGTWIGGRSVVVIVVGSVSSNCSPSSNIVTTTTTTAAAAITATTTTTTATITAALPSPSVWDHGVYSNTTSAFTSVVVLILSMRVRTRLMYEVST